MTDTELARLRQTDVMRTERAVLELERTRRAARLYRLEETEREENERRGETCFFAT